MCVVMLGAHLVLSELAVCVCCGAWSTPGADMCWLYACVVSVLAALGIRTYVLAICIVGCLACEWPL